MIDRALMYSARAVACFRATGCRSFEGRQADEAIAIAERNKLSHIAKVVATGLSEFQSASQQVSDSDVVEARTERSIAIVHAE
jgi:hypothetical protein